MIAEERAVTTQTFPPPQKTWKVGTLTYTGTGLIVLFAWLLLGDFVWSMRDRSISPMAQWYLKHLEASNLLYALILTSFPSVLTLLIAPVISYKSDRHRGRWGRRIPFLLVTTPIAAFGMIGMGLCPILGQVLHQALAASSPGEKTIALMCFGIFWAAFELATIAATAVFGGLINDVVPKEFIGRFYGLFRAVSLLDGVIFSAFILGHVDTHFTLILVAVGLFYGIGFLWVCLKVKEGDYPAPPPEPETKGMMEGFTTAVRTYMRECFTNPYYIGVFVMVTLGLTAFIPVNIFAVPFSKSLDLGMDVYGKCVAATLMISLCISYFVGWLADIFHPIRTSMVALLGYIIVAAWGFLFVHDATTFVIAFVSHGVLSGMYFTSAASLGQRLYPQVKFAQFASAAGAVGALCNMVLAPALGMLIDVAGNDYRYTYAVGAGFSLVALVVAIRVYGQFLKYGGPKNYQAPE